MIAEAGLTQVNVRRPSLAERAAGRSGACLGRRRLSWPGAWRFGIFSHRLKLLSLFGFDVWIDASWALLAALISWTLAQAVFPAMVPELATATYWWMAAVATIALFASIVFHEMAHSLVARRYGIPIRGITLFIFGGVAELEREPPSPRSELLMAAAGPAASLAIAAISLLLAGLARRAGQPDAVRAVLSYLGYVNGILAVFNLVPAFPLDGGRVLRAALWAWRGDLAWATRIAAGAGDVLGMMFIIFGVFGVLTGDFIGGMWRFLIGMFLRSAATSSYQEVVARTALEGVPVFEMMTPDPIGVPPGTVIAAFVDDFVYRHHHRTFPVTRQGVLMGSVATEQAAQVDRGLWGVTPVERIMLRCTADDLIDPQADALAALTRMRRTGRSRLWVVANERLVGVLSLSDMLEVLSARLELEGAGGSGAPPARAKRGRRFTEARREARS